MAIYNFGELTQKDLEDLDRDRAVVMLPLGAPERHGPHLPLSLDLVMAAGLAERAAQMLDERHPDLPILIHPDLHIGAATIRGIGSLKFSSRTFHKSLVQLGRRLKKSGITRVAFITAHGGLGHVLAIDSAMHRLRRRGIRVVGPATRSIGKIYRGLFVERWERRLNRKLDEEVKQHLDSDLHAGFVETSAALHLMPERVKPLYASLPPIYPKERPWLRRVVLGLSDLLARRMDDEEDAIMTNVAGLVAYRDLCWLLRGRTEGYVGNPAAASADWGEALMESLSEEVARAVQDVCIDGGDAKPYRSGYEFLWLVVGALGGLLFVIGILLLAVFLA